MNDLQGLGSFLRIVKIGSDDNGRFRLVLNAILDYGNVKETCVEDVIFFRPAQCIGSIFKIILGVFFFYTKLRTGRYAGTRRGP